MGLRTWVKQRLGFAQVPAGVDLLEAPSVTIPAPARVGLDLSLPAKAWSVARLAAIFRDAAQQPSVNSLQAARVARHRLAVFWLSAPVDQLESLYAGPLGELQRLQLDGPLVHQELAIDERQWRDQLGALMVKPEQRSRLINLLLALLPYTRPGKFQLMDAQNVLPDWLIRDYAGHCEPDLKHRLDGPAGLLNPAMTSVPLPVLSERRGEEALAMLTGDDMTRRIQALINLYGLAPDDQDTLDELSGLRQLLAQLWLDVEPSNLQTLYQSPVGIITRGLISAGFGSVLVDEEDQETRAQLKTAAEQRDIGAEENHGLVLAALLYFQKGKVSFDSVSGLPGWLVDELRGF